ncbi:unnamed protein product [Staurois parvus]|uniref:Uncharacterized protein n=1 Tax=Staurois parvus TaxID=386267 RepID=A0ABN9C090_9NEOB|nr:unnamed protein product [Staurois parvus]
MFIEHHSGHTIPHPLKRDKRALPGLSNCSRDRKKTNRKPTSAGEPRGPVRDNEAKHTEHPVV